MRFYATIVRPLLFLFPPEWIHRAIARLLPLVFSMPGVARLVRKRYMLSGPPLERTVFGIRFPNPVGMAAGFDKEANLYNALACFGFGHVEVGTVTPLPQPGNPRPRLFRLPADSALVNRMGFNNGGLKAFVKNLRNKTPRVIVGGNIGKNSFTPNEMAAGDYRRCVEELSGLVDYFVINVSCPNIRDMSALQDKPALMDIIRAVQQANQAAGSPCPVLLKIGPDHSNAQLDEIIGIVRQTGLDGIVATNTTIRRDGLATPEEAIGRIGDGGLSGAPIRNQSTRTISYIAEKGGGEIPVVGVGGIMSAKDALEKLDAGASLVQIYTGFVYGGPSLPKAINKALKQRT